MGSIYISLQKTLPDTFFVLFQGFVCKNHIHTIVCIVIGNRKLKKREPLLGCSVNSVAAAPGFSEKMKNNTSSVFQKKFQR